MKSLVFDTGPIISMATNNLLWILEPLKKNFNGSFLITPSVENELVGRPLETKEFKFEALQVMHYIKNSTVEVLKKEDLRETTMQLLDLANNSFLAHDHYIKIVSYPEMEALSAVLFLNSEALVVDERTTRLLVENPAKLQKILSKKLHTSVTVNKANLNKFLSITKGIRIIRSVELVTIAYKLGILDLYLADIPNAKKALLESVLWGVKLRGCSVTEKEIAYLLKVEV